MTFEPIVICVLAIVFYRAGQLERAPGLLWAALSTLCSLAALYFGWGLLGIFGLNVLLFVGITLFRVLRTP